MSGIGRSSLSWDKIGLPVAFPTTDVDGLNAPRRSLRRDRILSSFSGAPSLLATLSALRFRRFFAPHVRLLKYAARRNRAHDWHISFTRLILRSCYQAFPPPTYPVAYQSRVPRTRSIRASFDSPSFNFELVEELRQRIVWKEDYFDNGFAR